MEKIIEVAKKYVGYKEKPNNSGFYNSLFEQKMKQVGFYTGAPWCAFFAILCFAEAYPDLYLKYRRHFSGNSQSMFRAFKSLGMTSDTPSIGSLMIFRQGTSSISGHTAIVTAIGNRNNVLTIEGNTNFTGARNGDAVCARSRSLKTGTTGLNPIGFINIQ